jgi:hypothetical protein
VKSTLTPFLSEFKHVLIVHSQRRSHYTVEVNVNHDTFQLRGSHQCSGSTFSLRGINQPGVLYTCIAKNPPDSWSESQPWHLPTTKTPKGLWKWISSRGSHRCHKRASPSQDYIDALGVHLRHEDHAGALGVHLCYEYTPLLWECISVTNIHRYSGSVSLWRGSYQYSGSTSPSWWFYLLTTKIPPDSWSESDHSDSTNTLGETLHHEVSTGVPRETFRHEKSASARVLRSSFPPRENHQSMEENLHQRNFTTSRCWPSILEQRTHPRTMKPNDDTWHWTDDIQLRHPIS